MAANVYSVEVIARMGGFVVQGYYRAPFEDNFEPIVHPAVFEQVSRANAFAEKVKVAPNVTLKEWILPTDITSYIRNEVNPAYYCVL